MRRIHKLVGFGLICLIILGIASYFTIAAVTPDFGMAATPDFGCTEAAEIIDTAEPEDVFSSASGRYVAVVLKRYTSPGRMMNSIATFQVFDMNKECQSNISLVENSWRTYKITWSADESSLVVHSTWTGISCPCDGQLYYGPNGGEEVCRHSSFGGSSSSTCLKSER